MLQLKVFINNAIQDQIQVREQWWEGEKERVIEGWDEGIVVISLYI